MSSLRLVQVLKPFTYGQRLKSTRFGACKIYITPNIYSQFNNFNSAGICRTIGGFDESQKLDVFNGVVIQSLEDFEGITKVEQTETVNPDFDSQPSETVSSTVEQTETVNPDFDSFSTKELKKYLIDSGMSKKDLKGNKSTLVELCKAV